LRRRDTTSLALWHRTVNILSFAALLLPVFLSDHASAQTAEKSAIFSAPLRTIEQDAQRSRSWLLAQDYERNGAIDRAAEIYATLFQEDPRHQGYYQGVLRTFTQLRRFDQLVPLIERRLAATGELQTRAELGKAYYRSGDETKARAVWNEMLAGSPAAAAYSFVGAAMVENQLINDAVQVYLQGRRSLHQPGAFVFELASIYGARKEFEAATDEYLRYLSSNPRQLPFIQGKISELLTVEEAMPRVAASLSAALPHFKPPILIHRLLAAVHMQAKDYARALEAFKTVERLQLTGELDKTTPGSELYNFAEQAREAGAQVSAAAAYQAIASEIPASPFWLPAQFGLAQTLQARGHYAEALQAYEKVKARQPSSPWAMRAWFQEGEIYFTHQRMIEKAVAAFSKVYEKYGGEPEQVEAIFRLGDCHLALNEFTKAAEWYAKARGGASSLVQDKATYRLARLEFYQGRFRQTQKLLDTISGAPEPAGRDESMVNDALEMQLLIDAHLADSSGALRRFAHAELAAAQGRPAAAVDTLKSLLADFSKSSMSPLALFTLGARYFELGDFQQALMTYQQVVKEHPADMRTDRAIMRIAEIYENNLKDRMLAQQTYERILSEYPKSLFLDDARQHIRRLSEKPAPVMN